MFATMCWWFLMAGPQTYETRYLTGLKYDLAMSVPVEIQEALLRIAERKNVYWPGHETADIGRSGNQRMYFLGAMNVFRNRYHFTQLSKADGDPFGK